MVIDIDLCIGRNGCVDACNVEDNVGASVRTARPRHGLLRIDRHYSSNIEAPRTYFQPVPAMHCEKASSEMGSPVQATMHSPDAINRQIRNRCIGTCTCLYKVRRFNWYDFQQARSVCNLTSIHPCGQDKIGHEQVDPHVRFKIFQRRCAPTCLKCRINGFFKYLDR